MIIMIIRRILIKNCGDETDNDIDENYDDNDNDDDNDDDDDDDDDDNNDDTQGNPLLSRPDDRLKPTNFAVIGNLHRGKINICLKS